MRSNAAFFSEPASDTQIEKDRVSYDFGYEFLVAFSTYSFLKLWEFTLQSFYFCFYLYSRKEK